MSHSLSASLYRNSSNEIKVVVWRTGPAAKPSFEGLIHRPSYKPSSTNYDAPSPPTRRRDRSKDRLDRDMSPPVVPPLPAHHRTSRRVLVNGSEGAGGGGLGWVGVGGAWGERGRVGRGAEEVDGKARSQTHSQSHTATLKGTRVKASNGDNYIILAPINPGSQVLPGEQRLMVHPRLLPYPLDGTI